jgi:hypothetical protein
MAMLRTLLFLLLASIPLSASAQQAAPTKLGFAGTDYFHRWSQKGQHEFTPQGQADLAKWREMVTLDVHEQVHDGDQLAALANGVLSNYERSGRILRTDSKPRTKDRPAEHLIVAMLAAPGVVEASFARLVLVEGKGVVVVYSRRAYGANAAETIGAWVQANGEARERALMAWKVAPAPAQLKLLPQSK